MESIRALFGELKQVDARPRTGRFLRKLLTGEDPEAEQLEEATGLLFIVRGRALFGSIVVTNK